MSVIAGEFVALERANKSGIESPEDRTKKDGSSGNRVENLVQFTDLEA